MLYILIKAPIGALELYKKSKNWRLKEIWLSKDQKRQWSDNPGQIIVKKIENSRKIGHDKKSLIPFLVGIFSATTKIWFLQRRQETLAYVSALIWDFSNVSYFSKILRFKQFGNSWGNSYIKFVIPDIKFPFTCGKWNL